MVEGDCYAKEFTLTLYPNSVFLIPLSTNRLYTHAIKASVLPVEHIPTRLGYVIRCSNTKAVYRNGQTYIDRNGVLTPLHQITTNEMHKLKEMYFRENTTIEVMDYDHLDFSMNSGDYKTPMI